MNKKIHHMVPLVLLLLTLAPTALMGGLQAFQAIIRHRMEKALEKETLTTISVPAADVVWYEEGREIKVDGQMFDIKSYTLQDGILTATGMFDEDETAVVNMMNGHWSEKQQQHLLVQLLVLSHIVLSIPWLLFAFKKIAFKNLLHSLFIVRYPAPALPVYGPPPRPFLFL